MSCAHRNGVKFSDHEWPDLIQNHCESCSKKDILKEGAPKKEKELEIGEEVLAKNKNGQYYNAIIKNKVQKTLYHFYFHHDNSRTYSATKADIMVKIILDFCVLGVTLSFVIGRRLQR